MRVPTAKIMALTILFLGCLQIFAPPATLAQRPVQGMPVSELSDLDDIMQDRMEEFDINAAILGVMKNGRIVYLHGFGWQDQALSVHLAENTIMRIASCTKPFTAAAIRHLIDEGAIDLEQQVFQQTPGDGSILDYTAWNGVQDDRLYMITVEHLLGHRGGWDRNMVSDLTHRDVQIAEEMEFDPYRVPTQVEKAEWIMHQGLQFEPDHRRSYSNVGYFILGRIVEEVSGTDLYTYLREHIVDESMWFPATEFELGRTLAQYQNPREPWYDCPHQWENVFDPNGARVFLPYGGWNHESRASQGAMITTAVPVLNLLDNYKINDTQFNIDNGETTIGLPLAAITVDNSHSGRLHGTESLAKQFSNGANYVLILNKRGDPVATPDLVHVNEFAADLDPFVEDLARVWPTQSVDGEWIDFGYTDEERGTYDMPYDSINDLDEFAPYTKIRIKPGSSTWTGTITRGRITLSAPQGSVVIGGTSKRAQTGGSP